MMSLIPSFDIIDVFDTEPEAPDPEIFSEFLHQHTLRQWCEYIFHQWQNKFH